MVVLTDVLEAFSSTNYPKCDVILNSSSANDPKYDTFLSFRGIDTRNTFTAYFHKALKEANYQTFYDDEEIEFGKPLKEELVNGIKASRASVIVLSENYASSTWCLEELALILDQYNHIVFPIFYHVEPTDVRKQQKSFGNAMEKHKRRMEAETNVEEKSQLAEKIEIWKKALTQVANLRGKEPKDRLETEFSEEIVMDIYHRLGVPIRITLPRLIGMSVSIEFVTSWPQDESEHPADILTILGMGGIGKTSLAKYVYGLNCREFTQSSFIERISRRCEENSNGMLDLQKTLCGDISKTSSIQVHDDVSVYTTTIENALTRNKVFIVLDDIDSLGQLDALLGNKGFHPGSKIIITTEDASLTERCSLFKTKMKPRHTKCLLNVLRLPLALEVLGKLLHTRDAAYWNETIKGLNKEHRSPINNVLKKSFDTLPSENDKDLFKHIACFFVGKDRAFSETILKACDISTHSGINNLIDRCLVSIGSSNELVMHQLVQEMGRDVVRQESPNKPWKRSRLWCHKESFKVLKQKKGTENVLGLILDMRLLQKETLQGSFELKTDAFSNMDSLMILHLDNVQIKGSFENFPKELRWLSMRGFLLKSLPLDLPMKNLVSLDMSYSNIESFDMSRSSPLPSKGKQKLTPCLNAGRLLGSLKILKLSHCYQLRSLGGFHELPLLEMLFLKNCMNLTNNCDELVFIDLTYCKEFKKFSGTLANLKKVKTLLLNGCSLGESSQNIGDMDSPRTLNAPKNGIPRDSKSLAIYLPSSLVILSLSYNKLSIESFPIDLSSLAMLKDLYLDGNPLISMPDCLRSLPRLEFLSMCDCETLMSIEHLPRTLRLLSYNSSVQRCETLLRKIAFDPEKSLLDLFGDLYSLATSSIESEGTIKIQPMAGVKDPILRSLGWSNLEFINIEGVETYDRHRGPEASQTQMYYEYGIFSTIYEGQLIPNWIERRSKGPSFSFSIPTSPKKLTGMNFCYVQTKQSTYQIFDLPHIIISNITKKHTLIYKHYIRTVNVGGHSLTFLSHWMFGKNEMEDGDQLTISVEPALSAFNVSIRECGVSFVYDDRKKIR